MHYHLYAVRRSGYKAHRFTDQRFEKRQAGTYDSKESFEGGQERDIAVRFRRMQIRCITDSGGHLDAVKGDGTDSVDASVSNFSALRSGGLVSLEDIQETNSEHTTQLHPLIHGILQPPQNRHGQDGNHDILE